MELRAGRSSTRTVGEVIRRFADACAPWAPVDRVRRDPAAPHEATLLKLDTSKARAHLAWRPRLDLRETLEWTANWYRSYLAGADMHALTRMQLDQYMARRADC